MVHHKPVLNLSFPLLITKAGHLGKPESPKSPAEHHAHLHPRKVLPCAVRRSIREREERSWIMLPRRCTGAEPSFRQECVGSVKISWVSLDAIDVDGNLRFLWNDPVKCMFIVRNHQIERNPEVSACVPFAEHLFPSTLVH